MIAGIVLAAGRGERFGTDKMLEDLAGRALVTRVVDAALASRLDRVLLVTGSDARVAAAVRAACGGAVRLSFVTNPDAVRGHMTSVKAGLRALPRDAGAAVILLGDMPLVTAAIIDALLDVHRLHHGFVVPCCQGRWQHPRVIPHRRFAEFLALPDDAGGGPVFERLRDEVRVVDVGEPWNYLDVDTPADLAEAARRLAM